ncbi:helicase [Pseudomonas aeruginosa]|nr:helicase [Pseudomonas aeruginosa]
MKFRLLLWMLGRLMAKASRDNPAFQKQLDGKDLVFQLHTLDGKVARHYLVRDLRVSSKRGTHPQPAFSLGFKDGAYGFAAMTSKNPQLAFMQGIQNKDIQIQGNPALVIWFQGLVKYLSRRRRLGEESRLRAAFDLIRAAAAAFR